MSIPRQLSAIVLASVLSIASMPGAFAGQDATPETGTPRPVSTRVANDAPRIGQPAIIHLPDTGAVAGTLTIDAVIDPFEDTGDEPEDDAHFVAVTYMLALAPGVVAGLLPRTGGELLVLETSRGVQLVPIATDGPDTLPYREGAGRLIFAGGNGSGTVLYEVPDDVTVTSVVYQSDTLNFDDDQFYGHRTLVADLGGTANPTFGAPVTAYDLAEQPLARVTVTGYEDPFTVEDGAPGQPGEMRLIGVTVTVENPGDDGRIAVDPYQFFIQTSQGFLVGEYAVNADNLQSGFIPEGSAAGGIVSFVVPAGAGVSGVFYRADASRNESLTYPVAYYSVMVNIGRPIT